MGCHFLLQGIFLIQELNLRLLHWQVDSLPLSHQGSPSRLCVCILQCFCHVWLFVMLWTLACQVPLSMGFSIKNTGVACCDLLQGIFPTQGSNLQLLHLLHCQASSITRATWEALKCKYIFFMTSSPLLIPLVHRTPCRSSMIPKPCAVTTHGAGIPGSTRRKRQAMSVQGEAFWVRILKY